MLLIILAQMGSLCYYGNRSARRLRVPLEHHQMATGASLLCCSINGALCRLMLVL